MIDATRRLALFPGLACVTMLLAGSLAGCGDGRPPRVPVSGRVLIDGKPVSNGFIRVEPSNARPAVGKLSGDGSFELTTFEPGDGVVPGRHPVAVIAIESENGGMAIRHLVPDRYLQSHTSEIEIAIDEPTDDLQIELTWADSGRSGPYLVRSVTSGEEDPAAVVE